MKRLVYAPQINVWVKTETGIFDLSSYVTDFSIHRKVDAASTAKITFRNPKVEGSDGEPRFIFTQHPVSNANGDISYKPMFYPMDPIIISLTRLKGYPVQVFTGYCDKTPYIQLFPGTASLTASCTLKKLKYTYWDPGLPFVYEYLKSLGWIPSKDGGLAFNPKTMNNVPDSTLLNDSSFGHLVYRILQDIGGWDHNDIYVQGLPSSAIDNIVDGIYTDLTGDAKANFKDVKDFLNNVIGTTTVGGAAGGSNATLSNATLSGTPAGPPLFTDGDTFVATAYGPPWNSIQGTGITSTGINLADGPTGTMNGPYIVAVNPRIIPYHTKLQIWPNPFNYRGVFTAEDTGGDFQNDNEKRLDFYDPISREHQNNWGRREVKVKKV